MSTTPPDDAKPRTDWMYVAVWAIGVLSVVALVGAVILNGILTS